MGVRVEWHSIRHASIEVIPPGADWVGAEHQEPTDWVIAVSTDEVAAIYGTRDEVLSFARRFGGDVEGQITEILGNEVEELRERIQELEVGIKGIVDSWEGGDLAGAVNEAAGLLDDD